MPGLIGRTDELAVLHGMLDATRQGTGGAVIVRGPPGIGKTALLSHVAAAADGMIVLRATGVEAESHLGYSSLFDLCQPLVTQLDAVAPHHAVALRSAMALAAPGAHDSLAVAVGLLDLLATAANEAPVLVVVDDAHWIDTSSAESLAFVARRAATAPICLVMSARNEGSTDRVFSGIQTLELDRLSDADAAQLLADNSVCAVAPSVSDRLVTASDGNPLALVEMAEQLGGDELAGRRPLPDRLPVGPLLARVFDRDLAELPSSTSRLLALVALWEGSVSELESRPSIGVDRGHLQPAVDAGLVALVDDRVVFRHPLGRAAAVRGQDASSIRALHGELAELSMGDPVRAARHLAAATAAPDDQVAAVLVAAAEEAARTAAVTESVDLFERAAGFCTDPVLSADCLIRGAESAALGGSALRAVELVERASPLVTEAAAQLRIDHLRGKLALLGVVPVPDGRRLLADALGRAVSTDPGRAVRMSIDASMLAVVSGDRPGAIQSATLGAGIVRSRPELADMDATAEVALAGARAFDGLPLDEAALAAACNGLATRSQVSAEDSVATAIAVNGLIAQEYCRTALEVGTRFVAEARRHGAIGTIPLVLALSGKAQLYLDDIEGATVRLAEAEGLAEASDQLFAANYASLWSGVASAMRGDRHGIDVAAAAFSRRVASIGSSTVGNAVLASAFGHMSLSEGRSAEAVEHLDDVARFRELQGAASDGLLRWEGDYVEALVGVGREDDAVAQLDRLEERVAKGGSAWVAVVTARARALVSRDEDADDAFRRAVHLTRDGFIFARCRTELCWGEWLLASGRASEAGSHLRFAAVTFEGKGALGWASRARRHLEQVTTERAGLGPRPAMAGRRPSGELPAPAGRTVVTLGDLVVRGGAQEIRPTGQVARVISLLAVRGSGVHVEELADSLWPDASPSVGRTRLRNVLSRSRRQTEALLRREGDVVRLADDIDVDVQRFERVASTALSEAAHGEAGAAVTARSALSLYGGELVPSLRYDDWLTAPRERCRQRHVALLDLLANDAQQKGDIDEMLAYLDMAVAGDPYDEERYLRAARGLMAARRRGPALRLIERAEAMVQELGVTPDPQLAVLRQELTRSATTPID